MVLALSVVTIVGVIGESMTWDSDNTIKEIFAENGPFAKREKKGDCDEPIIWFAYRRSSGSKGVKWGDCTYLDSDHSGYIYDTWTVKDVEITKSDNSILKCEEVKINEQIHYADIYDKYKASSDKCKDK